MDIVKLERSDISALIDILIEYRQSQNRPIEVQRSTIERQFEQIIDKPDSHCYVSKNSDGQRVGFISFHVLNFPILAGRELYITELFVSEKHKSGGTGTALLEFAEEFGRQQGCTRLMLNNFKETLSYQRDFYKKRGFTERTGCANFVKNL